MGLPSELDHTSLVYVESSAAVWVTFSFDTLIAIMLRSLQFEASQSFHEFGPGGVADWEVEVLSCLSCCVRHAVLLFSSVEGEVSETETCRYCTVGISIKRNCALV